MRGFGGADERLVAGKDLNRGGDESGAHPI